jgi:hypothetical protein
VFNLFTWSGGVLIEYLVYSQDAYSRQGEYVFATDQGKNVSSLTLMSKGEKRAGRRDPNEMHVGACIAINAKGGDCWQIFNRQRMA